MALHTESEAARAGFDTDHVSSIDGQAVTSASTAAVFNPATGKVIASVPVTARRSRMRRSRRRGVLFRVGRRRRWRSGRP